jgi:hypothetical protein
MCKACWIAEGALHKAARSQQLPETHDRHAIGAAAGAAPLSVRVKVQPLALAAGPALSVGVLTVFLFNDQLCLPGPGCEGSYSQQWPHTRATAS